jgi:hypothetical protein
MTRNENANALRLEDTQAPSPGTVIALLVWLLAGAVVFLPFAFNTSPWDAVTLRVPGNQGNWWHALVGAPFFLAFPMIWLRFRSVFSRETPTQMWRRLIWIAASLSTCGTILVQLPFLLHLAGTSDWQRFSVLSLGFGIVIASAILLFLRRRHMFPTSACLVALDAAYLANAGLCLVVYSAATGSVWSRSGWLVTVIIVWPIVFELVWLFIQTFKTQPSQHTSRAGQLTHSST